MKMSIRRRLFLGLSFFIFIVLGLSWLLNNLYLEKYYFSQKKQTLEQYAKSMSETYNGNPSSVSEALETFENNYSGMVIIVTKDGDVKYNTPLTQGNGRGMGKNAPWNITFSPANMALVLEGKTVFEVKQHPRVKTEFLNMGYAFGQEDVLFLQLPVAEIKESVAVANDFYLYIGIGAMLLGLVAASIFSKVFTQPIIRLNRVTKSMAQLDFSHRCEVNTEDEIGQLANSINYLSNELDETISKLHRANAQLKKDIERERKIDEMRKEFISNVSHELKTPIGLIQGYAEGLKDNVVEEVGDKNFYCDVIIDEAHKMNQLVKDLLDLSQLESGHFKLNQGPFNLTQLINNLLKRYEPIVTEKQIMLGSDLLENEYVMGDARRIEQVLINYINNAMFHVDERSRISIRMVKTKHNKIRVIVMNTGKFIEDAEKEKLWTSFYKGDKARTRKDGRAGLGLSIVKGIMDHHHTGYGAENVDGGVAFWFELTGAQKNIKSIRK